MPLLYQAALTVLHVLLLLLPPSSSGSAARPATTAAPSSSGARQTSDKGVPPHQQLSRDQELRRTVKEIVQVIFQNAKEKSVPLVIRHQELGDFATQLPARQQNPVIFLRLPSGRGVKVSLRHNRYTLGHIQRDILDDTIRLNRVFLLIPGSNEFLRRDEDLRTLLPNIPELQVVVC